MEIRGGGMAAEETMIRMAARSGAGKPTQHSLILMTSAGENVTGEVMIAVRQRS
jgi:hypothetical protein